MELNGFWLIHRCFTITTHFSLSIDFTRTPHIYAEGSLKNRNRFNLDAVMTIVFLANVQKILCVHIIKRNFFISN
ncbi:hypothetical protein FEM08_04000 [Flavobacterium gilvum]|nr:hypothetical protein FEM08_04000 [Flavobacterium gilvum]